MEQKLKWLREHTQEFVPPVKYFYSVGTKCCFMSIEEYERRKNSGQIDLSCNGTKLFELDEEMHWKYQCTNGSTYWFSDQMVKKMSLQEIIDRCNEK